MPDEPVEGLDGTAGGSGGSAEPSIPPDRAIDIPPYDPNEFPQSTTGSDNGQGVEQSITVGGKKFSSKDIEGLLAFVEEARSGRRPAVAPTRATGDREDDDPDPDDEDDLDGAEPVQPRTRFEALQQQMQERFGQLQTMIMQLAQGKGITPGQAAEQAAPENPHDFDTDPDKWTKWQIEQGIKGQFGTLDERFESMNTMLKDLAEGREADRLMANFDRKADRAMERVKVDPIYRELVYDMVVNRNKVLRDLSNVDQEFRRAWKQVQQTRDRDHEQLRERLKKTPKHQPSTVATGSPAMLPHAGGKEQPIADLRGPGATWSRLRQRFGGSPVGE